jgi:hypothetical protein
MHAFIAFVFCHLQNGDTGTENKYIRNKTLSVKYCDFKNVSAKKGDKNAATLC